MRMFFAGILVSDQQRAIDWYTKLFGTEPTYVASPDEAVWDLAEEHGIVLRDVPARAGGAMHTIFVDDVDATVAAIAARGIEPVERIAFDDIREFVFRDADGNEIYYGGVDGG